MKIPNELPFVECDFACLGIEDSSGRIILTMNQDTDKLNRDYIVEACNNYPKAIEILKKLSYWKDNIEDAWWLDCPNKGGFDFTEMDELLKSINE